MCLFSEIGGGLGGRPSNWDTRLYLHYTKGLDIRCWRGKKSWIIFHLYIPSHEQVQILFMKANCFGFSLQNLLSSRLLSKNLKIKIYRTIIMPVVLYGCET